eukprot:TRINITY_DN25174_c0_g1_i1.p1 TRINITY_DN25174_c0_g1~~TRINITY_DN25174_c0_g1_i1.p1  ORF type:complete len:519 (-),score=96.03 TRINITY_DN25174_c0_g1_i1:137-1480(-)
MACRSFGLCPTELQTSLESIGISLEAVDYLPAALVEVLLANFSPSGRWSFFDLWARLLPQETMFALRCEGGVLCPRFFLVDLGSAALSPYDVEKCYPLIRQGRCIFVGQPPSDGGGGDAMRQGRQLEAELLSFGWLEEDHILTELVLPESRAIFSAAPDAVEGLSVVEPLVAGDDADYQASGYSLSEVFPVEDGKHEACRVWRADRRPAPPEKYVEVKKTTHINGWPGQFKLLKFWLQAALMRCGAVIVATTEGSSDGETVRHVQRLTLEELGIRVDAARVWGLVDSMLRLVLSDTISTEGPWTLRVQKQRGQGATVRLTLLAGRWDAEVCRDDPSSVARKVQAFSGEFTTSAIAQNTAEENEHTEIAARDEETREEHKRDEDDVGPVVAGFVVGEPVEGYWPEDDIWLPANVDAVQSDGSLRILWVADGSASEIPRDYARKIVQES